MVPVPEVLVAPAGTLLVPPAGTLVVPPAGVVFVPPAAAVPELFIVPELFVVPACEGPMDETPLLRLIPGLPTALGLLSVPPVVPLLLFALPTVLVLLAPATVPVGTAAVP